VRITAERPADDVARLDRAVRGLELVVDGGDADGRRVDGEGAEREEQDDRDGCRAGARTGDGGKEAS
jgi:hypothetical protein